MTQLAWSARAAGLRGNSRDLSLADAAQESLWSRRHFEGVGQCRLASASRHICGRAPSGGSPNRAGFNSPGTSKREDHGEALQPLGQVASGAIRGRRSQRLEARSDS